MTDISYAANITEALGRLYNSITQPKDKHNRAGTISEAYFWDTVEAYAKKKSKDLWEVMEDDGFYDPNKIKEGDNILLTTEHYAITAKRTKPIKRFDLDELASLFQRSKFKVPPMTTKDFAEKAKIPKSPTTTLSILEL